MNIPPLAPREIEIYTLLVTGQTIKQIVRTLGLSRRFVSSVLANVRDKVGAKTRDEATAKVITLGLLPAVAIGETAPPNPPGPTR